MSASSQPPDHFTQAQAGLHAERILQLAASQDTPGLVAYLDQHLPRDKWEGIVLIYSRSRELQACIRSGRVTITGQQPSPVPATIATLAAVLLA